MFALGWYVCLAYTSTREQKESKKVHTPPPYHPARPAILLLFSSLLLAYGLNYLPVQVITDLQKELSSARVAAALDEARAKV
jgi:hypothetical protein